jgi:LPXTG-motif cell wall-anchored protein
MEMINKFRTDLLATREELRATQFALRTDVDRLKNTIIALNVAGVPLLIGVAMLLLVFRRKKRALPRKDA